MQNTLLEILDVIIIIKKIIIGYNVCRLGADSGASMLLFYKSINHLIVWRLFICGQKSTLMAKEKKV